MAGLPSGVIHYYFESKDEVVSTLAEAIIEKYSLEFQEGLREAISPKQRIEFATGHIVERLIFNLIQMGFERQALNSAVKGMFKYYREQVSEINQNKRGKDKRNMVGASIVGLAEGFCLQTMVDPNAFSKKDVRRALATAIQDGVQ